MPTQKMRIKESADTTQVTIAAGRIAKQAGLSASSQSAISIAVSEIAMNIIKYAEWGFASFDVIEKKGKKGIEVIISDHGPGIEDIELAMQDHISSSGTLGLGLPGTKRLVDEFELASEVGKGTKVRLLKW